MRPFVHGVVGTSFSLSNTVLAPVVQMLDSDLSCGQRYPSFEQLGPGVSFVNYCVFTKQTFSCDSTALDFLTNFNFSTLTVGFNNCLSVARIREIEDMLLKGILSIRFWQVYPK